MRIASSDILFSAGHAEERRYVRTESLVEGASPRADAWEPGSLDNGVAIVREEAQATPFEEGVSLLDRYRAGEDLRTGAPRTPAAPGRPTVEASVLRKMREIAPLPEPVVAGTVMGDFEPSAEDKAKIDMLVAAIESLTGKKIKLMAPAEVMQSRVEAMDLSEFQAARNAGVDGAAAGGGWGMRYLSHESYREAETTTFEAQGVVKTADGQEVNIDLALSMSRTFMREKHIEVMEGAAVKDPLVINFSGTAADVTQTKFAFDIDSDGTADQIHFVGPGSGFLALDRDADGRIRNGNELFGPGSGDGFAELAAYDTDGNDWIDEADPVYGNLRIWSKDPEGNDHLVALGQQGIGAIYLGHATTPFQVKDRDNSLQGVVRSSGVYLNESGSAGTIQQVDLVV